MPGPHADLCGNSAWISFRVKYRPKRDWWSARDRRIGRSWLTISAGECRVLAISGAWPDCVDGRESAASRAAETCDMTPSLIRAESEISSALDEKEEIT